MKDECILNSSTQQPSSAIQSSSPTPTQRPSPLSSPPSSHVPTVQSNDDDTSSATTQGPTADASIFPIYDVSERNTLFYDLRFHSQFVLISISLRLINRFLHRRGMMKMKPRGQPLSLSHRLQQVHQNQPWTIYQPYHPLLQHPTVSKLKLFMIAGQRKHPGSYID